MHGLKTTFQVAEEEKVSCDSGTNITPHLQYSDASSDLFECMSEESVNMKSRTPLPFLKNILTFEQNDYFLDVRLLEESAVTMPEAASPAFDEIISVDGVPWAWSDGSSDESAVIELESPLPAQEGMACTQISHRTEECSMDFGVTLHKIILPVSSNEEKESSNRSRSLKQVTTGILWKNMKSGMAGSSKEQKQVTVMKVDAKQKREFKLRSSLPVRTSLLGKVEAKKKIDVVVEPSILKEKSATLDRAVKSVKPKQAGVIKGPGTSLSPIIIKKKTMAPSKIIQLSPKATVLPKIKSPMVKCRSLVIDSGGITAQSSMKASTLGEEKALKQFGGSQPPKSTLYCSPGLNYRKLSLLKNQMDAEKEDGMEEVHVVDEKLLGEQNHVNPRSLRRFRAFSSRPSVLVPSSSKEENFSAQITISNGSRSKKAQIDIEKHRTPYDYRRIQQRSANTLLEDKSSSYGKLSSTTSSSMSSLSTSAFLSSSSEVDDDGSKLIKSDVSGSKKTQIGKVKERTPFYNYKITQKSTKNVSLQDKSLSSEKISFRKGNEASVQKENGDECQLRFMKEKAATEAQNCEDEIEMISFKKNRATTSSSATLCPISPVMVLKHQDVQGINTQSLFNDVIEETANKLVEIRKSKVKALVGAFESIISLQERKV